MTQKSSKCNLPSKKHFCTIPKKPKKKTLNVPLPPYFYLSPYLQFFRYLWTKQQTFTRGFVLFEGHKHVFSHTENTLQFILVWEIQLSLFWNTHGGVYRVSNDCVILTAESPKFSDCCRLIFFLSLQIHPHFFRNMCCFGRVVSGLSCFGLLVWLCVVEVVCLEWLWSGWQCDV